MFLHITSPYFAKKKLKKNDRTPGQRNAGSSDEN